MKKAIALRHVAFEDLGVFARPLAEAGYCLEYHDVGVDIFDANALADAPLVVILGGPIGVYDTENYPFLGDEIALVRGRLKAKAPTLGICIGAQIMAAALGTRVAPTGVKEIGFSTVTLTDVGQAGPLRHLADVPLLHWHGDMFDIPAGADRLALTALCANQAFTLGANALALQFHPEVDAAQGFERWLIGHAVEIASAGIDPRNLRAQAQALAQDMQRAGEAMMTDWLQNLTWI